MSAKKTTPAKSRLNLDLTPEAKKRLEDLQERSQASSLTEVIRRSLAAYEIFVEQSEKNGRIILEDAEGNKEVIRLFV